MPRDGQSEKKSGLDLLLLFSCEKQAVFDHATQDIGLIRTEFVEQVISTLQYFFATQDMYPRFTFLGSGIPHFLIMRRYRRDRESQHVKDIKSALSQA